MMNEAASYFGDFGTRLGHITAVFAWTAMVFLTALFFVKRKTVRQHTLIRATAANFVLALLVWVIHVFAPVLVRYLAALTVGVVLAMFTISALITGIKDRPPLLKLEGSAFQPTMVAVSIGTVIIAFLLPAWVNYLLAALSVGGFILFVSDTGLSINPAKRGGGLRSTGRMGTDGLKVTKKHPLHGSAAWGTLAQASGAGHIPPRPQSGFMLGRLSGKPFLHTGHVLTCAPTGTGKGIGAVIPNLLAYPGSALVLDIKGENYAVTARHRAEQGHKVFVLDPFGVTGPARDAFNWLDRLNVTHPDCVGEAASLAECLVVPSGGEGAHFDETAHNLIQGLLLHVAGLPDPSRRHLGEVRRLLTLDEPSFLAVMADMVADPDAAYGVPARAANSLMSTGDRERGSILSTARRHTAFLDDPRIVEAAARSSFDFADMKARPVTVYVVIPPNRLEQNKRFMRGLIGSALAALTADARKPAHNVAFFLDEFAQLGRMSMIEDAISLVRGYGVSFWIFVQDISQLRGVYPKWQTFTANAAKQFFGTADFDTAKYISDSLGSATVVYETEGTSRQFMKASSKSNNEQFTGRALLTPDEVMRLGPTKPLVFLTGERPYLLDRLNYLNDPGFSGQFDPNPYH
ncbi:MULTISPECIES: type IV secretory system conjugative DNA transfer family protein [unclassified Azospirillum]|uniref:type IV secretory system conjugative DNA transfer family protein n=1 Tax=unclassified Azospirillum TaxID=2630922 RepID=UPI000B77F9A7|nr:MULTISPECIES: type IV secretory system conjugative DNA transfer family protein [unclassified Azospirillum]